MLKPINIDEAEKISKKFNFVKYVCNPFWLAFNCYLEIKNGEELIYERDESYPNDFPYIQVPSKDLNLKNAIINWLSKKDLDILGKKFKIVNSLSIGEEYYYETKDILNLTGSSKKDFRRNINSFQKKYNYKVFDEYPKKKVNDFLKKWAANQKEKNKFFDLSFEYALFCVKNMNKIKSAKWIFLEIDGKLAGFNLSVKINENYWIGVHQKVDYNYSGIGRFMFLLRAEAFKNVKYFTLGTGAGDEGITYFKKKLNPVKIEERFYVITGEMLS